MRILPTDSPASRRRLLAATVRHPAGLDAAAGPVVFVLEGVGLFPRPTARGWLECRHASYPLDVLGSEIQTEADAFVGTWLAARAAPAKAPAIVAAVCSLACSCAFLLDPGAFDGRVGLARGLFSFLLAAVVLPWMAASLRGAPTIVSIPLSGGSLSSQERLDLLAGDLP